MKINKTDKFIEVIGHYDNEIKCAKMTLLADLYAIEHREGYAKFPIECEDKLRLVDEKLEFNVRPPRPPRPPEPVDPIAGPFYNYFILNGITKTIQSSAEGTVSTVGHLYITYHNNNIYGIGDCRTATGDIPTTEYILTNGELILENVNPEYTGNFFENPHGSGTSEEPYYLVEDEVVNAGWFADFTTYHTEKSTSKVSVDLTTLPGWSSLSSGSHSITIVAKADGYRDSEPSAAVSVEKAAQEYTDCITFTGESSDFTLAVGSEEPKEWDGTVEYSTDHNTWTVWDGSEISSSSKKLYLRGSGNTTFYMLDGAHFILSARAACSGNIQTLLEYSNPPAAVASNCYYGMFDGCKNLTQAPALPATTLAPYCYKYMFDGCTNLLTAPALPATTLADYCYNYMFHGCTSLTTAPVLPATTLTTHCYQSMFSGCTSLTTAPVLPATTLATYCYSFMFDGCKNLTAAPELPATALANDCYNYMFRGCTSLTTAPELPVTTLTEGCYSNMFYGCTSLTTAPVLPATTLAPYCYTNMFYGCTSLTRAPELPATTLANSCYYNMFNGCTSLRISSTRTSEYSTAWRIPSSGTISSKPSSWNTNMLSGTGGTFKSNPNINTTYYGAW